MSKPSKSYRKRKSIEEWRELINKFDKSGVTKDYFAKANDISVDQINHWMRRFAKEAPNFIPVTSSTFLSDPIRICLPTGIKIECTPNHSLSFVKHLVEELI